MRHGFGSFHGSLMGYGDGGMTIILIILLVASLTLIAPIVNDSRKKNHPEHRRLMCILKGKYAEKAINPGDLRERSMLLEDEYRLDSEGSEMLSLKERYARCEIDSPECVKQKEELKAMRDRTSSASFKERPV